MKDMNLLLDSIERKVMVIVHPHPDDETVMMGGLVVRAASRGWKVVLVCLTKGERGRIYCHGRGRSLAEIREEELGRAWKRLGGGEVYSLDYHDGFLRDNLMWVSEVESRVKKVNPSLVVTYEPSGLSGHQDHVVVSREVFSIVKKYRKAQLLWVGMVPEVAKNFVEDDVFEAMLKPEYELKLSIGESVTKSLAILAHWSQGLWTKLKLWVLFWYYRVEYYSLADLKREYEWNFYEYRI